MQRSLLLLLALLAGTALAQDARVIRADPASDAPEGERPRIAGVNPYPSAQAFIEEYAGYRGREIVAFRELDSYQRAPRARVAKQRAD
jgi:hypothetical protein